MKKKVGPLCAAESITRPSTSGTTTAAASSTAKPRSSIPDGPWPALPPSPTGDIPARSLPDYSAAPRRADTSGPLAADEQFAEHAPERDGDARAGASQAFAEHRR